MPVSMPMPPVPLTQYGPVVFIPDPNNVKFVLLHNTDPIMTLTRHPETNRWLMNIRWHAEDDQDEFYAQWKLWILQQLTPAAGFYIHSVFPVCVLDRTDARQRVVLKQENAFVGVNSSRVIHLEWLLRNMFNVPKQSNPFACESSIPMPVPSVRAPPPISALRKKPEHGPQKNDIATRQWVVDSSEKAVEAWKSGWSEVPSSDHLSSSSSSPRSSMSARISSDRSSESLQHNEDEETKACLKLLLPDYYA